MQGGAAVKVERKLQGFFLIRQKKNVSFETKVWKSKTLLKLVWWKHLKDMMRKKTGEAGK